MNLPGILGVSLTGPCLAMCSDASSLVYLILKCLIVSFSSLQPRQKCPQSARRPESKRYGAVMMAINLRGSLVVLSTFGRLGPARSWTTARRSKSRSRFRTRLPPSLAQAVQYRPGRLKTLGGFAARRRWRLVVLRCRVPSGGVKKLAARPIVRGEVFRSPGQTEVTDSAAIYKAEMIAKALARGTTTHGKRPEQYVAVICVCLDAKNSANDVGTKLDKSGILRDRVDQLHRAAVDAAKTS